MNKIIMILSALGISALMPRASFGACSYLKSEAELMNGVREVKLLWPEMRFIDPTGKQGKAVIRSYLPDIGLSAAPTVDVVLYNGIGQVALVGLAGYPAGKMNEAKVVRIHPDRDSISIAYNERGNGGWDVEWLTVIDPATCQLVGISIDHLPRTVAFPIIEKEINTKDPQYKKENAYLQRVKFDRGFFTKEMVAKDRGNPKWSN